MVTYKNADDLSAACKERFPEDSEQTFWLCREYAGDYAGIKGEASFVNDFLDKASGLPAADIVLRKIQIPRRGGTDTAIMDAAHRLARSDRLFEPLTKAELLECEHVAVLQREARKAMVSSKGCSTDVAALRRAVMAARGWAAEEQQEAQGRARGGA